MHKTRAIKMPKKLTDYRSFWTVWLGCAGSPDGRTLFSIQKEWGITTNYLYHKEPGLNKPMHKAMAEEGFLEKAKVQKKIIAKFGWTTDYVIGMHKPPKQGEWSMNLVLLENWVTIHAFMEKHRSVLFDPNNLKTLYGTKDIMASAGRYIFDDIFAMIIVSNILPFCKKYRADLVSRIIYTLMSMQAGRNTLGYFKSVNSQLKEGKGFPTIIINENALMKLLYPSDSK